MPERLPIFEIRDAIVGHLRDPSTPNLLVKAPTGSGKSTQVPQFILDGGLLGEGDDVVVLQPRRMAARMLARRVAQERNCKPGTEVGWQVRFENTTSRATRLRYVTEGVLLRQLLTNPTLKGTSCVIIDEFHERHLDGDLALAWARAIQKEQRPDLKIIVMSATLAPGPLAGFLAPCETLESEGRTFPVETRYQAPGVLPNRQPEPAWDQAVRACESLASEGLDGGHMLVFMPGAYEIRKTLAALSNSRTLRSWKNVALHGELPPAEQDAAVSPGGPPRIIVSTNVAETSLTIEGVRAVVDSGLARVAAYDSRRGINTLTIEKISQASAEQRAGRAGRLGPGIAVRLWSQAEHNRRPPQTVPEVHRLELSEALLALKTAAADSGLAIDWFEPPKPETLERARTLLHSLDAIDEQDKITPTGRSMAGFPAHPRLARLLLAAADLDCLCEAAACAAIAQGRGVFAGKNASGKKSDFWESSDLSEFQAAIRALQHAENMRFDLGACADYGIHARSAREAAQMRHQLLRLAERSGLGINDEPAQPEALAKALLAAFSDHLGSETGPGSRVYTLGGGYRGHLPKEAHIKPPPLLIAAEVAEIQGKALQVKLNSGVRFVAAPRRELRRDPLPRSRPRLARTRRTRSR
jgi:ATP-dependent helicase HrpB